MVRGTRLSQACECRSCGDWLRECVSSGRASIAVPCVQRAFENVPRNPGRRLRAGGTKLARALPALLADPLVQAAREAVVRGDYATLLDLVGVVPLMLGDGAFSSNSSSSVDDGATLGMAPTEASSVARIAAVVRAHLGGSGRGAAAAHRPGLAGQPGEAHQPVSWHRAEDGRWACLLLPAARRQSGWRSRAASGCTALRSTRCQQQCGSGESSSWRHLWPTWWVQGGG